MKGTKLLIPAIFTILFIAGCGDDDQRESIVDTIEVRLYAASEVGGKEQKIFEENSDLSLGLKLVNTTHKAIEAGSYADYCSIFDIEEFLTVYKWATNDHDNQEGWVRIGKAYVPPVNCPQPNIPVIIPAHGEVAVASAAWSLNPENAALGPGKYNTALSYTLTLEGKIRHFNLKLEFNVHE